MLKDGSEWGFLADHVAEYRRLGEVLRRKVAGRDAPPELSRADAEPEA
jgi:hypothetical protein